MMVKASFFYAAIFIAIGVIAWAITGMEQATALIPAYFGILLLLIGVVSRFKESLRPHLMHVAMVLVLLGLLGSIGGLFRLIGSVFTGAELARPVAVYAQSLFALASMGYLYTGIRSFIDARKKRAESV
jgi:hypothetical protein